MLHLTLPYLLTGKCDFAHSALELRVKENRRGRWGQRGAGSGLADPPSEQHLRESGGEDVLGSARSIEKVRAAEGSVSEFERSSSTVKKGKGGQGQGQGQGQAPSSSSHYNLDQNQNQGQQQQQFYVQQRRQLQVLS